MSELATGDEVEVFGQRGHVNRIEAIAGEIVRVEVQHKVQDFGKPQWQGWFVPYLLTLIAPPAPEPQVGEVWEHVGGDDRLFFHYAPASGLWCTDISGTSHCWDDMTDKHYYSKVEA